MYLSRSAPFVAPVVVSIVVDHTTAWQWGAFLSTLHKGLSSEGSQGFLKTLPGLLAETLEWYFLPKLFVSYEAKSLTGTIYSIYEFKSTEKTQTSLFF